MKIVQQYEGDVCVSASVVVCEKTVAHYEGREGYLMAEAFVHGWYRGRAMNYEEPEREKQVH